MPIALLLQLASMIPSLMKYVGASDTHAAIAQQAVDIATTVTGIVDPTLAVKKVIEDPAALQAFQLQLIDKQKEWDQMFLNDIANARARDVEFLKAGKTNTRANWMITLDAIGLLACLFVLVVYKDVLPEGVLTLITTIASIFGLCLRDAHQFEFGSSRSSQQKDTTINKLSAGGS